MIKSCNKRYFDIKFYKKLGHLVNYSNVEDN